MKVVAVIFVHNPLQWKFPVSSTIVWPLIRLFSRSYWNHCALMCEITAEPFGNEFVIVEALGKGVTQTPYEEWRTRAERNIEEIVLNIECDWLPDAIGRPYDYASLLWWKLLKKITGRWYGPRWEQAKKAVFCSELCAMVIGINEPWGIDPGELYKLVKNNT